MSTIIIDRESDTPLYIQVRDAISNAIKSGDLAIGDKLPPVAQLSKEIGVTQATIRRALQDLTDLGYAECHVGRGTFITDPLSVSEKSPQDGGESEISSVPPPQTTPVEYAARRLRSGIRKALFDIMPLAHKPEIIQLTRGTPDTKLLPDKFLDEITEETLAGGSEQYTQATEEHGLYQLREEIAMRFNENGAAITPDQVLITNGSLQGATLVAQAALEKRPGILCETPCFQGITDTFSAMGHWVETVQRDQNGPIIEQLYHQSRSHRQLLYLCPYAHNPMGTNLSRERSAEIVEWARKTGSVVVADEIFKDICFVPPSTPSLFHDLGEGQAIIISSLSKSVMTGLRLGWIISSPERISELARLKHIMDHSTPAFIQGMAHTILTSGKYDHHIKHMQLLYQERMATMLKSLATNMPKGVSWSIPTGGFSILVELPRGYSSVGLLLNAIDKGVSFLPGPLFDIDQRYNHALRLSTAWVDRHQIKEGIELLGSAIHEFMRTPPGDTGLSGLGNFQ